MTTPASSENPSIDPQLIAAIDEIFGHAPEAAVEENIPSHLSIFRERDGEMVYEPTAFFHSALLSGLDLAVSVLERVHPLSLAPAAELGEDGDAAVSPEAELTLARLRVEVPVMHLGTVYAAQEILRNAPFVFEEASALVLLQALNIVRRMLGEIRDTQEEAEGSGVSESSVSPAGEEAEEPIEVNPIEVLLTLLTLAQHELLGLLG